MILMLSPCAPSLCCSFNLYQPVQAHFLDQSGSTFLLLGGLSKPSSKILWEDVDRFCVDAGGRGTKTIGYRFVPGREPPAQISWLRGKGKPALSVGRVDRDMVQQLNAYRRRALPEGTSEVQTCPSISPTFPTSLWAGVRRLRRACDRTLGLRPRCGHRQRQRRVVSRRQRWGTNMSHRMVTNNQQTVEAIPQHSRCGPKPCGRFASIFALKPGVEAI